MVIRPAAPGDEDALRAVRLRALADAPDSFGSTLAGEEERPASWWAELAAGERGLVLLAVDGDAVLGMAGAFDDAGDLRVWGMWVAPQARGAGVGRALLKGVVAWARAQPAPCLDLCVSEAAPAALALYRATGFAAHGDGGTLRAGSAVRTVDMRKPL